MNKILLAAGLLAMAASAQADCTSTVSGFYGVIKVGYGTTTVSDKITTKAAKITGNKNFRKLAGGVQIKDGTVLRNLSEAELAEYQKLQNKLEEYNSTTGEKIDGASLFNGLNARVDLIESLGTAETDLKDQADGQPADSTEAKNFEAFKVFKGRLEKVDSDLESIGLKVQIDGKDVKISNLENVYLCQLGDPQVPADPETVQPAGIFYKVEEGKTLDIVSGDKIVGKIESKKIGSAEANGSAYGVLMLSQVDGLNTVAEGDAGDNGLLDRNLAKFKVNILQTALSGKFPGLDLKETKLTDVNSTEAYSEELKAATKEIKSHKNNMNIGMTVGYQHAFGVFYTGVELGAEFVPGKVKVQNIDVDGKKAHQLGASTFTYEKEIANAMPEISLKTKYSFGITPMFGITSGNWMFYIPVTLKFTKYDLSVTPSSTFAGINAPTVSYPGTDSPTMTGPYTLSDAKVVSTEKTAVATDAKAAADKTAATTMSTFKKGKTKFGVEFGLGAKVMLSKNVFVGIRYMYSPKTSIKIDTPAYTSNALHDPYRLGANHKVSVTSHKGILEIGYKF